MPHHHDSVEFDSVLNQKVFEVHDVRRNLDFRRGHSEA